MDAHSDRLIECLPFFQMSIVFDYIQKYPLRTKQILGISIEQAVSTRKPVLGSCQNGIDRNKP